MTKSRRVRWAGHVEFMRYTKTHTESSSKTERKRPLLRPMRKWEDNIRNYFTEAIFVF
jgi:hypothetical protein